MSSSRSVKPPVFNELTGAVRALAMDAVQQANSGHPGAPMGMAEMAEVLWRRHLRHNPANPAWADRDRFVLSNGHGSMLIYALLHLTGYDLPIEEIRNFRQLHSRTPGHPEYGYTPGVETTTGPLGQGISNAVGMALAEKLLAAEFNRPGHAIVDHHTWVFLGDGCLMEGISHEVCSLAGTLGLGKLIALYDDNNISIDGEVGGFDRCARALGSTHAHQLDRLVDAARQDDFSGQRLDRHDTGLLENQQVDIGDRQTRQLAQAHFDVAAANQRLEAALGQATLQRHLAALEALFVETARTRLLALVATATRLAQATADATTHATRRLAGTVGRLDAVQTHINPQL